MVDVFFLLVDLRYFGSMQPNATLHVYLPPANNFSFNCTVAASNPPLESVMFEFPNGTAINISHDTAVMLSSTMLQSGEYICIARNPDLSNTLTYNITIGKQYFNSS